MTEEDLYFSDHKVVAHIQEGRSQKRKYHKMKRLLFVLMLLTSLRGMGQISYSVNPSTQQVSNLNVKLTSNYVGIFDFDLKQYTSQTPTHAIATMFLNVNGTGRIATFINSKNVFTVAYCKQVKSTNLTYLDFTLETEVGNTIHAWLVVSPSNQTAFWLLNKRDNTSVVFSLNP